MKNFEYIAVQSIRDACSVLAEYGSDASIIAGGTDLLVELRRRSAKVPKVIIDVSGISELHGVKKVGSSITIKPLTTHTQLAHSNVVQRLANLISSSASTIGSPQIRNRGTIGGNIMNAAPCADTVPALIALDVTITLQSRKGRRELALADLFVKPYQTKATPDEMLVGIRFHALSPNSRSAFIKLGRRNAVAISRLSVASILEFGKDGQIVDARIVPGSAFPVWRRISSAEKILIGEKPSNKLFTEAGKEVSAEMIRETGRRWSTEYKEPVLAVLVRRALEQCTHDTAPSAIGLLDKKSIRVRKRLRQPASRIVTINTTINGRNFLLTVPSNRLLIELLRDDLGFTGTKCGCEIGECGACTVLLDGQAVNSCLVLAAQIDGHEIQTIEGLGQNDTLHPLQESFMDHDAVHCGFCTPGMLMSSKSLLDANSHPSETEIRTAISGNLCRCTGYIQIVEAVKDATNEKRV